MFRKMWWYVYFLNILANNSSSLMFMVMLKKLAVRDITKIEKSHIFNFFENKVPKEEFFSP